MAGAQARDIARWVVEPPASTRWRWLLVDVFAAAAAAGDSAAATGLAVMLSRVFPPASDPARGWDDMIEVLAAVLAGHYRLGSGYRGLADALRTSRRAERKAPETTEPDRLVDCGAVTSFEGCVVDRLDARARAGATLARLASRDRRIVWRRLALGEPERDVAEACGVSPATVRRRVASVRGATAPAPDSSPLPREQAFKEAS